LSTGTVRTGNVADVSEGKVFDVVGCGVVVTETTDVGGGTYVAVTVFVMVLVTTVGYGHSKTVRVGEPSTCRTVSTPDVSAVLIE
jgi:hypothetical protein